MAWPQGPGHSAALGPGHGAALGPGGIRAQGRAGLRATAPEAEWATSNPQHLGTSLQGAASWRTSAAGGPDREHKASLG